MGDSNTPAGDLSSVQADNICSPAIEPMLSVKNLSVEYRTASGMVNAMRSASLEIYPEERVALVGESGSGKSTLGLAVAGMLTHPDIAVSFDRLEFRGAPLSYNARSRLPLRTPGLSMVFQDAMTSLDPVWPVGSQLIAVLRATEKISRAQANEEARYWLGRVGLDDTARVMASRPYELSGGMRQRAMMAIALCSKPKLLIADEPTSALDATLSMRTMDLLVELTESSGAALLIISHDIALCEKYTGRMLVAYQGRIVEEGSVGALRSRAKHPYTRGLLSCIPTLDNAEMEELPTMESVMAAATNVPAEVVR